MILISGYYGFGNLGDEAILAALTEDLASLGLGRGRLFVLSANPRQTEKEHGVQALPRLALPEIWRLLGSTRLFISGGGSLLQDVTSKRSLPYYLGLAELAFLRRIPVVFYAQGLGPISTGAYLKWVKRAFSKSAGFTLRDQGSARFLQRLGLQTPPGSVAADPVFRWGLFKPAGKDETGKGPILLNIRPYSRWEKQRPLWLHFLRQMQDEDRDLEFIPLGPGDLGLGKSLQKDIASLYIHPTLNLKNQEAVFAKGALTISMRLHGIIFSALQNVLPIGINYDPKVEAICEQLGVLCWPLTKLGHLTRAVETSSREYSRRQALCSASLLELKELTELNRRLLAKALHRSEG